MTQTVRRSSRFSWPIPLDLSDFSGGLNARDGFAEVASDEWRDGTLNWTLDERAAATVRKGCPVAADFPALPGHPSTLFYSATLNLMIAQVTNGLYKCAPGGGAWVLFRTTGSNAVAAFCDFAGKLVYVQPLDGVRTYDGAVDAAAAAVSGTCIAAWQNKVWVGGGLVNANRIYWSNLGNPAVWTFASDFIDLREKDDTPITALFGGPTLIAFKEASHYRINDSSTGAFTTVDWNAGAVGARAVIGGVAPAASGLIQEGGIFFWGLDGLYAGDGLRPATLVGDKLRPRFIDYTKINATTKPLISAGIANGRIYFAFPKVSASFPETVLEYHPRDRWLAEHLIGATTNLTPVAFTSYKTATRTVTLAADANGNPLVELMTSSTRTDHDGTSVAATFKSGFIAIDEGRLARMQKAVFTVSATVAAAVTFAASYLDDYLGTEQSSGLTFGSKTLPAGTSNTTFNASGKAPAFSFTLTASGVAVTLRRILATLYRSQF